MNQFARTEMLIGEEAMNRLKEAKIAVFGVGGVGGYVIEALARSGVGALDLIDNDVVSESNINRQIIATRKTIGQYKTEVMRERIMDINPDCKVRTYNTFFLPETKEDFDFSEYTYVVDAIDTVAAKIALVLACQEVNTPIISSMGTGNKLNPTMLEIGDIYKTSVCPLARVMRYELKKRGVKRLKVLFSKELPIKPAASEEKLSPGKRAVPGSTAFVPSAGGLIIASEIVRDIVKINN